MPVHADPVYWNSKESNINIARHMICSVAGVPMVSMDLTELPSVQRNIIEYWLDFYKGHLDTFRNGHWHIKYKFDHLAFITVEYKSEKIVFICDDLRVSEALSNFDGKAYILNLSNNIINLQNSTTFDCTGKVSQAGEIPVAGAGVLK